MPSLHLIFTRAGVQYALETTFVDKMAWLPELSAVADASPWVIGAFNHHGCVVPVLDLALCFGRGRPVARVSDAVVVLEVDGVRFAVVADELVDATPMLPGEISGLDEHRELLGAAAPLVSGVAMRGERLAMVLDTRALLAGAEAAMPAEGEGEDSAPQAPPTDFDRDLFLARARTLAQSQETGEPSAREHFALARVDAELIGIPVHVVRELMRLGTVWPVPCCPPHILGSMNVRGDILTLVDLRPVIGLLAHQALNEVVIVRHGELTFGLAVGEILDIVQVDGVIPPPLPAEGREMAFCWGTARAAERIFTVIDIEAMLASRVLHVSDERGRVQALPEGRVLAAGG